MSGLAIPKDRLVRDAQKVSVRVNDVRAIASMQCEHELHNGLHCDKADIDRGGCCNACWARRWAEGVLRGAGIE